MKPERLDVSKARLFIQSLIKDLIDFYLRLKAHTGELLKLRMKLKTIDESNPEYYEILHDQRENNRMNFRFAIFILSNFVDFLLLNMALDILCDQFGLPKALKYVVPITLIILEIAISYFSTLLSRDEDKPSRLGRNLQYFVLPLLAGFSLLAIIYNAQSYNQEIDGMSLLAFMTFNTVIQLILLISSVMLHLWLIRNSEDLAEAISYMRYKVKRNKVVKAIDKIEKSNSTILMPQFTRLTHEYIRKTETFKRKYPDENIDFTITMPQELIDGINKIMGKKVIKSKDEMVDNFTNF
jgi:hypothetical protein